MPEDREESQGVERTYSTGEIAKACGVSVRTVQYYDQKGLLHPSEHTEGGRRVYNEADAAELRKILLLKSLGIRLGAIRGVLESDVSVEVLKDILREQDRKLAAEVDERNASRQRISVMLRSLETTGELPANDVADMEETMENTNVYDKDNKRVNRFMAINAIPIAILEWGTIVYGVMTGNWVPFAIALPIWVVWSVIIVIFFRQHTAYVCPHCHETFVPGGAEWFFAFHTPRTRKVTCTHCHTKDWCAEVYKA